MCEESGDGEKEKEQAVTTRNESHQNDGSLLYSLGRSAEKGLVSYAREASTGEKGDRLTNQYLGLPSFISMLATVFHNSSDNMMMNRSIKAAVSLLALSIDGICHGAY